MGMTEIVQAVMSPSEKLIEVVSGAIGKAYEPKHVRKMAEAKAYELKLISETIRNNSDMPINYDSTGISIDTSDYEELIKRTSSRLAYQEIAKQQNIEAVADKAYEELENETEMNTEDVDQDWVLRLFSSVENISDEEMQKIWGHVLAGEIKSPNSYSYRTLERLKNMSRQEAEIFVKVASLALRNDGACFVIGDDTILNKYDVYFSQLLALEECGLMTAQTLSLNLKLMQGSPSVIYNSKIVGVIKNNGNNEERKMTVQVYVFTESGKQLMKAVHFDSNREYAIECFNSIRCANEDLQISAYDVNWIDDKGTIHHNLVDILAE